MSSQSLSNWIQLVTATTVVAGIGLVIWELRQSREIATAQLVSDSFAQATNVSTAVFGDKAAETIAKACENPDSLDGSDMTILDAYYRSRVARLGRMDVIELRTGLYDKAWQEVGRSYVFPDIFFTAPGRAWWKLKKPVGETGKFGDALLTDAGPVRCQEFYQSFKLEIEKILKEAT